MAIETVNNKSNALAPIVLKSHDLGVSDFFWLKKSDLRSSFFGVEKRQLLLVLVGHSGNLASDK